METSECAVQYVHNPLQVHQDVLVILYDDRSA